MANKHKGEYQDRRDNAKVDCSNTIWILATNALDSTVLEFCDQNGKILDGDEVEKSQLSKQLSRQLREAFLHWFKVGFPYPDYIRSFKNQEKILPFPNSLPWPDASPTLSPSCRSRLGSRPSSLTGCCGWPRTSAARYPSPRAPASSWSATFGSGSGRTRPSAGFSP